MSLTNDVEDENDSEISKSDEVKKKTYFYTVKNLTLPGWGSKKNPFFQLIVFYLFCEE